MPAGRPSKYQPEFAEQAKQLCELGATDRELASFFKVKERTIYRWSAQHPEFCQALKVGKERADDRVERSLYRRATGYSFDAVKINQYEGKAVITPYVEHVPPDTTAAIFWLKNRRPQAWRDVKAVEHTHKHVHELSDEELAAIAAGSREGASDETASEAEPSGVH